MTEQKVSELVEQFGHIKINLLRPGEGNEGVWAVPMNKQGRDLYDNDKSSGDLFNARLCNEPIGGWYGREWGDVVTVRTNGGDRPTASHDDNPYNS